ncbi:hypothetical protein HDU84_001773, partial [Entophlyctis sp. JEL0112]
MLLLSSDSGMLSFVFIARDTLEVFGSAEIDSNDIAPDRFELAYQIRIAPPGLDYMTPGQKLAVDTLSRAVAVFAHQCTFKFFVVSPHVTPFAPITDRLSITVSEPGFSVWDALFLRPDPQFPDTVTLVVVVTNGSGFSIFVYTHIRTNTNEPPRLTKSGPFPLPELFTPSATTCLATPHAFALVGTADALSAISVRVVSQPTTMTSTQSGASVMVEVGAVQLLLSDSRSIAVGVAPCPRQRGGADNNNSNSNIDFDEHEHEHDSSDALYVVTDEGDVLRIWLAQDRTWHVRQLAKRGPVRCMCVVDEGSTEGEDILLLCGDMCDGEVLSINYDRETVNQLRVLPNSSPVLDFKVGNDPTSTSKQLGRRPRLDRLFLTSGVSPFGFVREMRMGLAVSVEGASISEKNEFKAVTGMWNINTKPDNGFDNFLGISFISSTRLYQLLDDTLEDISHSSGLLLDVTTLHMASAIIDDSDLEDIDSPGAVVQVYEGGIMLARPSFFDIGDARSTLAWVPDSGQIMLAASAGQSICVCLGSSKAVVLLKISSDGRGFCSVAEVARVHLKSEPSCLHVVEVAFGNGIKQTVCIVGTRDQALLLLEGLDQGCLIIHEHGKTADGRRAVLVGYRDGTVSGYLLELDRAAGCVALALTDAGVKVGAEPVRLFEANRTGCARTAGELRVMALSDRLWTVGLSAGDAPLVLARPVSHSDVKVATPFVISSAPMNSYVFACTDALCFVTVEDAPLAQATGLSMRSLSVGNAAPRRVLYDRETDKLLVACNVAGKSGGVTGEVKLIDPHTGEQYLRESLAEGELCYSMTIWNIKAMKRYICLGTWGYRQSSLAAGIQGRVLVYSLKYDSGKSATNGGYKMKQLGEFKLPEMVFSVQTFMNSYLLIAAGNCLYQLKIDTTTR